MSYRDSEYYRMLEHLIEDAGVKIIYEEVPNDSIDGEILARADINGRSIMMPNNESLGDEDAMLVLGHEMGHILTGTDSPDEPVSRLRNESECNLVGVLLTELAIMMYEKRRADAFSAAHN